MYKYTFLKITNIFIILLFILNIYFIFYEQNNYLEKQIKAEIKGAVKNPGVYKLNSNSRVEDLIEASGGLIKDSDVSSLNLSKTVEDESVLIIYTKEELTKNNVIFIENSCSCPVIKTIGCIDSSNNEITKIGNKVSLNIGTKEELMTLTGIGESKALAIIKYREENNGFKTLEEFMEVKGIGKSTYEKNKANLTL